jgi:hypothetical protein
VKRSLDALIHLHLEGALTTAEAAELSARLASDPAAARRLAEMAYDQEALKATLQAPAVRRTLRRALPVAAAAVVLLAVGAALWLGPGEKDTPPAVPAGTSKAFRGRVRGTVITRNESLTVRLQVTEDAGHPLAGRSIHVAAGFQRTDAGDVVPHRMHQAFLKRLEPGQAVALDLRDAGEDIFLLGELTPEQAESVKRDLKKQPRDKEIRKPVERGDRDGDSKEER